LQKHLSRSKPSVSKGSMNFPGNIPEIDLLQRLPGISSTDQTN